MAIDWIPIKNEYLNTEISQRALANKYNVSDSTLTKKANKEHWQQQKEINSNKIAVKVQQKTQQNIVASQVKKIDKILQANEQLLDRLLQAIPELSTGTISNTTTVKTTQGNKAEEVTTKVDTSYTSPIKIKDLNLLAAALKNIQEINRPQSNAEQIDKLDTVLEKIGGVI